MSDGVVLMGIKPSRSNQLMVEIDGSGFAKRLLLRIAQYLSSAD